MLQLETLNQVKQVLVEERPASLEDCVAWACKLFQDNYTNTIKQLLFNFPADQVTTKHWLVWALSMQERRTECASSGDQLFFKLDA